MILSSLIGLAFVLLFFGLIIVFAVAGRARLGVDLRDIPAFGKLRRSLGLAVEAGRRIHFSVGRGSITGTESAAALVGLSMLERISRAASVSDKPPVATSGNAALAILTQDTLRSTYREIGAEDQYDFSSGRLTGVTPFSYAAGTLPVIRDEQVSASVLIGNFSSEVALIADEGDRVGSLTLAGADNLIGQAVLYATTHEPLIGEELYAGGAYLQAGPIHTASLQAQDAIRWLLVVVISIGIVLKVIGLDVVLLDMLRAFL